MVKVDAACCDVGKKEAATEGKKMEVTGNMQRGGVASDTIGPCGVGIDNSSFGAIPRDTKIQEANLCGKQGYSSGPTADMGLPTMCNRFGRNHEIKVRSALNMKVVDGRISEMGQVRTTMINPRVVALQKLDKEINNRLLN